MPAETGLAFSLNTSSIIGIVYYTYNINTYRLVILSIVYFVVYQSS